MPVGPLIVRPPTSDKGVLIRAAWALGKIHASGSVGVLSPEAIEAMAVALVILGLRPVVPGHPDIDPET